MRKINFLEDYEIDVSPIICLVFLICNIAIMCLTSCSNMASSISKNSQEVAFNPAVGSKYRYEFDNASEVIQEIGKSGKIGRAHV